MENAIRLGRDLSGYEIDVRLNAEQNYRTLKSVTQSRNWGTDSSIAAGFINIFVKSTRTIL